MTNDMTKGNPLKIFIFFTIPLLIGNIFQQLYSMVDTIIVGRFVGVNALAAVGATGSMFFLVNGMIQGLTSGFAVLVAQKFGAKEEISLKKAVASNINLTIISTIVITIVALIVKTPLLKAMNTPDNIFKDANTYITIIFVGIITQALYNMSAVKQPFLVILHLTLRYVLVAFLFTFLAVFFVTTLAFLTALETLLATTFVLLVFFATCLTFFVTLVIFNFLNGFTVPRTAPPTIAPAFFHPFRFFFLA